MTHDAARPRDYDEILDDFISEFEERRDNPQTDENDVYGAIFRSFARVLAENQEQTLAEVYRDLFIESADGEALTQKCKERGVIRRPAVSATGVVEFRTPSTVDSDVVVPSGTRVATEPPNQVRFETVETATIAAGTSSTRATVKAISAGDETNVPAGKIRLLVDSVQQVSEVTNPFPTGDLGVTNTDGSPLVRGRDRESDQALRERALDEIQSLGGAGTLPAIRSALGNVNAVESFTTYIDQTNDTIEPVVYGGTDVEVAQALFGVLAGTTETVGGNNGTAASVTIESELLPSGSRTINFSRPTVLDVDVTVDVAVTSGFVGKTQLRRNIVEYIGGTRPDGTTASGVGVGESPLVGELRNTVNAPGTANGVVDVTALSTTPSVTTDANGVREIPIAPNEVARVDGTDDSITINVTEV